MSLTVCIAAKTIYYPDGGGHFWVYLNWALGFKAIGCNCIWLEYINDKTSDDEIRNLATSLNKKLESFGLTGSLALCTKSGKEKRIINNLGIQDLSTAADQSDILINQWYGMPLFILQRFRKTIFLDIDPGLTQMWMAKGVLSVSPHDLYFTIGETVGSSAARFSDHGLNWLYVPPCVSIEHWPIFSSSETASYTTVTHWSMDLWEQDDKGKLYSNDKRTGFLPYLSLPAYVPRPMELALYLAIDEEEEKKVLELYGWRLKNSRIIASTPDKYRNYIQTSRGEFSCVKPSCVRLQNAWISDRTICYLASGKPAIVEYTGPSRFLPDSEGLLRFKNLDEAIKCIGEAEANYDKHSRLARTLAEEYFDAKKVTKSLLERAL